MWRVIRRLSASKPVIASMSDAAASGGYYMAMAAQTIVAEKLTLTGLIGVVTGKFNLGKLYERIGFNREMISRGRYAEFLSASQHSFRPHEADLFEKYARNAYKKFRDKAASSRSMTEVVQGRVWSGKDAVSNGLVDAIGGLSRAMAIAKQKANISQLPVQLVEISEPSPTSLEKFDHIRNLLDMNISVKELLQDITSPGGVQARMDDILFERLKNEPDANSIFKLIKDCLRSF